MVDTDAYGCAMLAADVQERNEFFLDFGDFIGIFGVCVLQFLETSGGVNIVARIDAHFLGVQGRDVGNMGVEVDVGNEGHVAAQ